MKQLFQSLMIVLALLLAGCYTERKATHQLASAQAKYPVVVARGCALWYPVREYDSTRVEYVPGEAFYQYDTVVVNCDSILRAQLSGGDYVQDPVLKYVRVPCPPVSHRVDTVFSEHYKQVENTAALFVVRDSLNKAVARAIKGELRTEQVTTTRNRLWWAAGIGWAILLGGIALRVMKPKLLS